MKPHIIPFLMLFLIACNDQKEGVIPNKKIIDINQFTKVNLTEKGKVIADIYRQLGDISMMRYINDSIIAICQSRSEPHVGLYNVKTKEFQSLISKGSGPNEMLRVSTMSVDRDGRLWLAGLMDRKVLNAEISNDRDTTEIKEIFKMPEEFLRAVSDSNGGLIGLPMSSHCNRILLLDSAGEVIDSIGNYPDIEIPNEVVPNNLIFQSDIAYSPESKKIILVYRSWNFIDILNQNTNETVRLEYPIDKPIEIQRTDYGAGFSYDPKPVWLMFSGVETTPDSFMVGFIGKEIKSQEDFENQVKSIMEFDNNGNPGRMFIFKNDIQAFCISPDGEKLLTVENTPDPVIYEYSIIKN